MKKVVKTAEPAVAPAVVVFGYDESDRPHAAWFGETDAELAERAAGLMRMNLLRVTTDEHRAAALAVAAGRIFPSGKAFAPFCNEGSYDRLARFNESFKPEPPTAPLPQPANVPATWDEIGLHSLVLAADGETPGWFEAIVCEAKGDLFELRWVTWPDLPTLVRRREHVSLLSAPAHRAIVEAAHESSTTPPPP